MGVADNLFAGGGEMGVLMRSHDWSATPLGAVTEWPQSLRTALSICLNSRFPMVIWWGPQLLLLYNDAWRPMLGNKHPQALGRPGCQVWGEIWDIIGAELNTVLLTGQATWSDDSRLIVERYGYREEAYFTYSYSPILDEGGRVGGAFTAVNETTGRVLGERRLATLRNLADQASQAKTAQEACTMAIETIAHNPADIPFALLYLLCEDTEQALLSASTPLEAGTAASPICVDLTSASWVKAGFTEPDEQQNPGWPLAAAVYTGQPVLVENLVSRFGSLPLGAWDIPPQQAVVQPIWAFGQERPAGLLVVGVNPCRALDGDYRNFLEMAAGHIASAIANAGAYESQRKRAESLAELDRAKTAFFSNVSHEFRTPLTLMLGPVEEALADVTEPLPPVQRERIEVLQRNGLRLLKLVNTLLDFSRLEAGRVQAVYEATDLASFTAELASVFRSAIEGAGLTLTIDCPPLPELIYVDRDMWEKIVLNLVSNAFKFTFDGGIAVRLRLESDRTAVLEVQDTGVGIPAHELPSLFERFHRVSGTRSRTHEGSGIGLALIQELVKLHGGTVTASSLLGEGTTFTIAIPTGVAHLPAERIGGDRNTSSTALGAAPYVLEALRWLPEEGRGGDGERGRGGAGEQGRGGDGEQGRWGEGEMGRGGRWGREIFFPTFLILLILLILPSPSNSLG